MKKVMIVMSLIFSLVFLSSCADKNTVPQDTKLPPTINDYFSFAENIKYVYEGQGNEYASYIVFVDFLTENRVQLRSNNGGTEMVKVLENKEGKLTMLLSRTESYYRESLTQSPNDNPEILLQEPLIVGTSWTLADNRKRSISNTAAEATTPAGTYKALEVTTEGKDSKTLDYYAPNIGLVKTIFLSNGSEISSSLSKIDKNIPFTQTVQFYYPDVNENKLYFVSKKLSFHTNDLTKIAFEKAFKDSPKETLVKVLSPNVKIKSLYLNHDNAVYADFTKELVSEMNAGSGTESMILQSITNTLGAYYGADKVYITLEGSPYSSGHIMMKKGELFTVNLENSVELK